MARSQSEQSVTLELRQYCRACPYAIAKATPYTGIRIAEQLDGKTKRSSCRCQSSLAKISRQRSTLDARTLPSDSATGDVFCNPRLASTKSRRSHRAKYRRSDEHRGDIGFQERTEDVAGGGSHFRD